MGHQTRFACLLPTSACAPVCLPRRATELSTRLGRAEEKASGLAKAAAALAASLEADREEAEGLADELRALRGSGSEPGAGPSSGKRSLGGGGKGRWR